MDPGGAIQHIRVRMTVVAGGLGFGRLAVGVRRQSMVRGTSSHGGGARTGDTTCGTGAVGATDGWTAVRAGGRTSVRR